MMDGRKKRGIGLLSGMSSSSKARKMKKELLGVMTPGKPQAAESSSTPLPSVAFSFSATKKAAPEIMATPTASVAAFSFLSQSTPPSVPSMAVKSPGTPALAFAGKSSSTQARNSIGLLGSIAKKKKKKKPVCPDCGSTDRVDDDRTVTCAGCGRIFETKEEEVDVFDPNRALANKVGVKKSKKTVEVLLRKYRTNERGQLVIEGSKESEEHGDRRRATKKSKKGFTDKPIRVKSVTAQNGDIVQLTSNRMRVSVDHTNFDINFNPFLVDEKHSAPRGANEELIWDLLYEVLKQLEKDFTDVTGIRIPDVDQVWANYRRNLEELNVNLQEGFENNGNHGLKCNSWFPLPAILMALLVLLMLRDETSRLTTFEIRYMIDNSQLGLLAIAESFVEKFAEKVGLVSHTHYGALSKVDMFIQDLQDLISVNIPDVTQEEVVRIIHRACKQLNVFPMETVWPYVIGFMILYWTQLKQIVGNSYEKATAFVVYAASFVPITRTEWNPRPLTGDRGLLLAKYHMQRMFQPDYQHLRSDLHYLCDKVMENAHQGSGTAEPLKKAVSELAKVNKAYAFDDIVRVSKKAGAKPKPKYAADYPKEQLAQVFEGPFNRITSERVQLASVWFSFFRKLRDNIKLETETGYDVEQIYKDGGKFLGYAVISFEKNEYSRTCRHLARAEIRANLETPLMVNVEACISRIREILTIVPSSKKQQ